MIYSIKGEIQEILEDSAIVENSGISYKIYMCSNSLLTLKKGSEVSLFISASFSMYEGQLLYGFLSREEKEIFELFKNNIPNTGSKKSLEYLNKVIKSPMDFKKAIYNKDVKALTSIFGFTNKTAQKIADLLKSKIEEIKPYEISDYNKNSQEYENALNALISLGYKSNSIKEVLKDIFSTQEKMELQEIIKLALKKLR
jgi:Holliday junction DNA helicase RuvA